MKSISKTHIFYFFAEKQKSQPPYWADWLGVSVYLFSRIVTNQVSSAQVSLTSVFGMGTGGPSPSSTLTILFHRPVSVTTSIYYHIVLRLSSVFLNFFCFFPSFSDFSDFFDHIPPERFFPPGTVPYGCIVNRKMTTCNQSVGDGSRRPGKTGLFLQYVSGELW